MLTVADEKILHTEEGKLLAILEVENELLLTLREPDLDVFETSSLVILRVSKNGPYLNLHRQLEIPWALSIIATSRAFWNLSVLKEKGIQNTHLKYFDHSIYIYLEGLFSP